MISSLCEAFVATPVTTTGQVHLIVKYGPMWPFSMGVHLQSVDTGTNELVFGLVKGLSNMSKKAQLMQCKLAYVSHVHVHVHQVHGQ